MCLVDIKPWSCVGTLEGLCLVEPPDTVSEKTQFVYCVNTGPSIIAHTRSVLHRLSSAARRCMAQVNGNFRVPAPAFRSAFASWTASRRSSSRTSPRRVVCEPSDSASFPRSSVLTFRVSLPPACCFDTRSGLFRGHAALRGGARADHHSHRRRRALALGATRSKSRCEHLH